MSGVSYLTSAQWSIAATNPPHLAAINPWERWSDTYREVARHGGIPETYFWPYIGHRWGCGTGLVEDLAAETAEHPLFDDFWASKAADLSRITVPAFVVASWSDQGLHTRGTFEGFKKIGSRSKWLDAHGGKKWGYYYAPDSLRRQQAFFDHFLKGADSEVTGWPPVSYEVRDRAGTSARRSAGGWPLPGTSWEPLFLDAGTGSLRRDPAGRRGIGVLRQRAGRPGPRPGHLRPAFRDRHRAGRQRQAADLDVGPGGRRPGRVRCPAKARPLRRPRRLPLLRGLHRWPGRAGLDPGLPPRARRAAVDPVPAGPGPPAGAHAPAR